MSAYLSSRYRVRPQREEEFVAAWEDLAVWSEINSETAGIARLLQSHDDPTVFVGFWDFRSADDIERWIADPEITTRLDALRKLAEASEPEILELRAEAG